MNEKINAPKFAFRINPDRTVDVAPVVPSNITTEIPAGIYSLESHPERGLFLRPSDDYKLPSKIYGDATKHVDRFLRSYELNNKNLGVLLAGVKGSGKTILIKATAQKAVELDMVVILINTAYAGTYFLNFMASITQNSLVILDEYDKTYSTLSPNGGAHQSRDQNSLLQLLDGAVSGGKKLYMFSVNNLGLVNEHMIDRPSRVRYAIHFNRLELATAVEYVKENLKNFNEDHLHAFAHMVLCRADGPNGMSFDSMSEFVTEMNQFRCNLTEAMAMMRSNGSSSDASFKVDVYADGRDGVVSKGLATGNFTSPYMATGEYAIAVENREILNPDDEATAMGAFSLSKENFTGFVGDTHTMLEFKKDGNTFLLTYTSDDEYHHLKNAFDWKDRRNWAKKENELQKAKQDEARKDLLPGQLGVAVPKTLESGIQDSSVEPDRGYANIWTAGQNSSPATQKLLQMPVSFHTGHCGTNPPHDNALNWQQGENPTVHPSELYPKSRNPY